MISLAAEIAHSCIICGISIFDRFIEAYCRLQEGSCFGVRYEGLGLMHYFLGLEVWQRDGEIFLG
jgi:hypothetical protein